MKPHALPQPCNFPYLFDARVINDQIDDETFAVVNDSHKTSDGQGRQLLEASFFRSSQYLALARGAMAFTLRTFEA